MSQYKALGEIWLFIRTADFQKNYGCRHLHIKYALKEYFAIYQGNILRIQKLLDFRLDIVRPRYSGPSVNQILW